MLLFFVFSLAVYAGSLYFEGLVYCDFKHNCATFLNLPSDFYAMLALLLLATTVLSLISHIRSVSSYGLLCGLLVGGGLYHIQRRLVQGCVLDYFRIGELYFNFSDVAIVVAIVFLVIISFIPSKA